MIITCPCKECTKETGRYPGCHDHCEKPEYKVWRQNLEERRRIQDQERAVYIKYQGMSPDHRGKTKIRK